MTELLTAAQMRALEEAAIASGEVTGLELMERAGRGVIEAIMEWRPVLATAPHRAVVLCGPGNNGGDGFVVARLLKERGWDVEVFLYGDEASLPPDAAENCRRWREMGEVSGELPSDDALMADPVGSVVVDALFGTGLTRPLDGPLNSFVTSLSEMPLGQRPAVVAVDISSGLCADSGRVLEAGLRTELTVSFHRAKQGHRLACGPERCGVVVVADIGLRGSPPALGRVKDGVEDWELSALSKDFFFREPARHKYDYGHALILSGGPGTGGAARLAARGCLRIGPGLVTVGCPPEAVAEHAARLDAIMLAPLAEHDALRHEIVTRKVRAVCIGPGFGTGERLRAFLEVVLDAGLQARPTKKGENARLEGRPTGKRQHLAVVLDADALSEFEDDPETLFQMLHEGCVLTPHEGEFGRLFPDLLGRLKAPALTGPAYSKVDATREAAARAGCTVLFKGPDTVIAEPAGRCSINSAHYERAAPWLATAGSGDVLAGFITGLLARGLNPMAAAEMAAWLHVECARKFGPGLIAEDLPEMLPAVFRELAV